MENKFWVVLFVVLLIGSVFVTGFFFHSINKLKDPCGKCLEEERPEIAPCVLRPIPAFEIKINLSENWTG